MKIAKVYYNMPGKPKGLYYVTRVVAEEEDVTEQILPDDILLVEGGDSREQADGALRQRLEVMKANGEFAAKALDKLDAFEGEETEGELK